VSTDWFDFDDESQDETHEVDVEGRLNVNEGGIFEDDYWNQDQYQDQSEVEDHHQDHDQDLDQDCYIQENTDLSNYELFNNDILVFLRENELIETEMT
jgi:hypothetical protein